MKSLAQGGIKLVGQNGTNYEQQKNQKCFTVRRVKKNGEAHGGNKLLQKGIENR
jgi:hypothetical protein